MSGFLMSRLPDIRETGVTVCLDYKTKKLRNYAKLSEVSSGFEPEYTVLQTGA